jgi:hypothetical protein
VARRSLAFARDDEPASFPRPGFAIPSGNARIVIPSRNPQSSFRAAGEESPPLATPGSLAFARDDKPAPFPRPGFVIPSGNARIVIPSRNPQLSFRAAGEESPHRVARRSLAFAPDGDGESFQAQGEESPPLATPRSLAFARDDDGESFQAQGEKSALLATPGSLALLGMTEPVSTRATRTCGVAVSRACVSLNRRLRRQSLRPTLPRPDPLPLAWERAALLPLPHPRERGEGSLSCRRSR